MRATYEDAYRGRLASFVQTQLASLEKGLVRHPGRLPHWRRFSVDRPGNACPSNTPSPATALRLACPKRNGDRVEWVGLPR